MSDYIVKVENINGVLVTTSNRVAEELGVRHDHLLDKIDDYLSKFNSPELSGQFYIPHNYKDRSGKSNRNYLITKKGVAQLVGGYSAAVEKAFQLNVDYINEFEKMENFIKENLVKRADINDIDETKKKNLEIRERYSKVKLAETLKSLIPYSNSEMYKEILVSETAKILTGKGIFDKKNYELNDAEINFLKENAANMTLKELAVKLGRKSSMLKTVISDLNLKYKVRDSKGELWEWKGFNG